MPSTPAAVVLAFGLGCLTPPVWDLVGAWLAGESPLNRKET